jgi:hypothetical protein
MHDFDSSTKLWQGVLLQQFRLSGNDLIAGTTFLGIATLLMFPKLAFSMSQQAKIILASHLYISSSYSNKPICFIRDSEDCAFRVGTIIRKKWLVNL